MRSVPRHHGRMRLLPVLALPGLLALGACGDPAARRADSTSREPAAATLAECYRSPTSAMGRTTPLDGHTSVAPGWLRFDAAASGDSGAARIIDADGARFEARWRRTSGDSIEVRGFDDFMEIHLRAVVSDGALNGSGLVTSDADVQRDAAGRLEPLRREWPLSARAVACSEAPALPA